ncbi:MAG: class E sortase [Ignavibacteria bacterium]|nr:class E sortase [Ignavibacteria bacterium]
MRNKYLILLVILILIIYLIYPYWPKVQYYFTSVFNKDQQNPISYALLNTSAATQESTISVNVNDLESKNILSIPKIGVKTEVIEGDDLDVLNVYEGVWREPGSSTPLVAGNMVIAGHRFQYLPPNTNTFYNLEEMVEGDDIYVFWQGKTFWYKVYKTMLVNPDQIEIRDPDPGFVREITLYTCTPLYTSDKRFVVKASLIGYQ